MKNKIKRLSVLVTALFAVLMCICANINTTAFAEDMVQEVTIDDVTVKLSAPEGILPEGAVLSVKKVVQEKKILFISQNEDNEKGVSVNELNEIQEIVEIERENQNNNNKEIESTYILDICILDANGNEIEPTNTVNISFSKKAVEGQVLNADVYHIIDENDEKNVETLETTLEVEAGESIVSVETESFSYYTVDFYYNDLKISLEGNENKPLKDILEPLGLYGEVANVKVSNKELFDVLQNDEKEWVVYSYQSFDTDEWMKVEINDVEYYIDVKDPTSFTANFKNNSKCAVTVSWQKGGADSGSGSFTLNPGASNSITASSNVTGDSLSVTASASVANGCALKTTTNSCSLGNAGGNNQGSCVVATDATECDPGNSRNCTPSNGTTVTLTIKDCNYGTTSSKTRTRANGTQSCANNGTWNACLLGSWGSCPDLPTSCSRTGFSRTKTIIYHGHDGSVDQGSDSVTGTYTYTFTGWDDSNTCITSNKTVTAQYRLNIPNPGGITLTGASKTGYHFEGWDLSSSGTGVDYTEGQTITFDWTNYENEEIHLYAVYSYDVNYYSNPNTSAGSASTLSTHTGSTGSTYHIYDKNSNLANSGFRMTCYYTKYWNTNSSLTGTNYTPGQSVSDIPGSSNPRSLYAVWDSNSYQLVYNANGNTIAPASNAPAAQTVKYDTDTHYLMTSSQPTRKGYEFIGWSLNQADKDVKYPVTQTNYYDQVYAQCSNVQLYAKWRYKLKNNTYVNVSGKAEGIEFELAPGEESEYFYVAGSNSANVQYDDRNYYEFFENNDDGTVGIYAKRKTQTLTFDVYNDNGYSVIDTVSITTTDVDLENGDKLNHDVLPTNADASIGDFTHSQAQKTVSVNANSRTTLTFTVPEGSHLTITSTNNSSISGFSNTKDYITLVETPEMYADTTDEYRKNYDEETEMPYIVFKSKEDNDKHLNRDTMILDNQYQRASYGFVSDNTATFKLYECLTDACTVEYTVQSTEHDVNDIYYAQTISSEIDGESKYLDTKSGTSGQWTKQLDVHKHYKLVQESLIKNRYYSWDSGYELSTQDYTGYNSGSGTLELNYLSEAIKIDVDGVRSEPFFAGNTAKMGSGGSLVTSTMKQPFTEVNVKTVTSSNVPVSDVEMYFGARTDTKMPNENIYVAQPTTKDGVTFSSASGTGKALQPDIDYSGYLGGSWVTDLSGAYAPFNGYLANNSWYKEIKLPMPHYQDKEQVASKFYMVIDTAKLTLKAKADIGNVNAKFDVIINNAQFSYGEEGENGEMIRSNSAIVMRLGSNVPACSGDEMNTVCMDGEYYSYTIDVPVDKLITVKHDNNNAIYYNTTQACDIDTDKYSCRSYVPESVDDAHIETFDLTRKSATVKITAKIQDVVTVKDIINNVHIKLTDATNKQPVCDVDSIGDYCDVWDETFDWSIWGTLKSEYTDIEFDGTDNSYSTILKPTMLADDSETIVIPAGMTYEFDVDNDKVDNWFSNFINGLFKTEKEEGYKSFVDIPVNTSSADATQNVGILTSSYQYARYNISAPRGLDVAILDKDSNPVTTLSFTEDNQVLTADLQYDLSPYTFTQPSATTGFYNVVDVVSEAATQDGVYDIVIEGDRIELDITAVGECDGATFPIANIPYAIGTDENNIVCSGVTNADGSVDTRGLLPDNTYNVYFGGTVNDVNVTNYLDVQSIEIPLNKPDDKPSAQGTIPFIKKEIKVNDIYSNQLVDVRIDLEDSGWTYNEFENSTAHINVLDGTSEYIYVPNNETYTVIPENIPGYHVAVNEEPGSNIIEINYELQYYEVDITATSNIGTTFTLVKNGVPVESNYSGNFHITYTVEDTYVVTAIKPEGYAGPTSQPVRITIENDVAVAAPVVFTFRQNTLTVSVTNMIGKTKVNLHSDSGNIVETIETTNADDITFYMTYDEGYYVTVDWPEKYYRNTTHYPVDTDNAEIDGDEIVAPVINPARELIPDDGEYFILNIKSLYEEETIPKVTYSVYYQGTNTIAKDINKEPLAEISGSTDDIAVAYLDPDYKYEVRQISVPSKYELNTEVKKVVVGKSQIVTKKSYASSPVVVIFNNGLSDIGKKIEEQKKDINKQCTDAREKLANIFNSLDKKKYSKKQWAQIQSEYDDKLAEINIKCSALEDEINNADGAIVYSFDMLFAEILALAEEWTDILNQTHWLHWVIIILSLISIIANALIRDKKIKYIIFITALLISLIICLAFDRCIISLIAIAINVIAQFVLIVIKKNNNNKDVENKLGSDKNVSSVPDNSKSESKSKTKPEKAKHKASRKKKKTKKGKDSLQDIVNDAEDYIKDLK